MGAEPTPILITGATGAIGLSAARALAAEGHPLVLWVRDRARGEAAGASVRSGTPEARIELVVADLASMRATRRAAAEVASAYPRLRGVLHAAGVFTRHREETDEGLERMFATNHLGPFLLTRVLQDRLPPGGPVRFVFVTSPSTTPVRFDDLQSLRRFRSLDAFAATKTAHLLTAYALARRCSGSLRTSNAFFPGVVRSPLLREAPWVVRLFARSVGSAPTSAGESLAWLLTGAPLASANGRFFEGTRVGTPSTYSTDPAVQERLWSSSERLLDDLERPAIARARRPDVPPPLER